MKVLSFCLFIFLTLTFVGCGDTGKQKYSLRSSSKVISLTIKSSYPTKLKNKINFELILKNKSEKLIRLYKPNTCFGKYILLMSSSGEFMLPVIVEVYSPDARSLKEKYIELPSGGSYTLNFPAELKTFPNSPSPEFRENIWLYCGGVAHKLSCNGSFKVYGQYSHIEINPPYDNIWTGRVVSEPIDVILNR